MLRKRLISVVSALIVLGVAACGGGSSTGPTVVYPPAGAGTSSTLNIPPVNGINATVTVSNTGTVQATGSTTPPSGTVVLNNTALRVVQSTGSTPVLYLSVTAVNGAATLTSVSSVSVNTGSTPAAGNYYLAYWNGSAWVTSKPVPGTISGNVITVTGSTLPAAQQTLAAGASDYFVVYNGVVVPVTPTPSPSPTPTPTPVATPQPDSITNGDFETGSLTPWYVCYTQHAQTVQTDAMPVNSNGTYNAASPLPTTAPTTAPTPNDVTVQNTAGIAALDTTPHGGSYVALAGMGLGYASANRGKGAMGLCQNIAVPAAGTSPTFSFWVNEGGNMAYYDSNEQEADVFAAAAGLASGTPTTTSLPVATLMAENNCWNVLDLPSQTGGNSAQEPCDTDGSGGGSGVTGLDTGGVWRQHTYSLSAYAGTNITVFLGIFSSSTSTTYYNYALFDDVHAYHN